MPLGVTVSTGRVGDVTGDVTPLFITSGFTACDDVTTWLSVSPLTAPTLQQTSKSKSLNCQLTFGLFFPRRPPSKNRCGGNMFLGRLPSVRPSVVR